MFIRLSKNAFVRQYGPFTYILERIREYDEVFTDAEIFMRWIDREPHPVDEVVDKICKVYSETPADVIKADFNEFLDNLIQEGVVVSGETAEELANHDHNFSYDVENPKTMDRNKIVPRISGNQVITQDVLDKYFSEHPTIFSLQIDITQACTERCIHCYIPEYNPIFLPLGQIKKVIDEFAVQGGIGISFSGGECMLHPDFDEIVRYARSRDLIVGILSNLTLCTDAKVEVLREVEAAVQVSLYSMVASTHDAITKVPGSFNMTKAAIERIRAAQIPCLISCPTMKLNFRDYLGVLDYARSLKMDAQTDFIIMGKMDGDTSNLACRLDLDETSSILDDIIMKSVPFNSEYFDPKKKEDLRSDEEWCKDKVCGACTCSICLDATGNYYPCPAFAGINLGSCYEHDLRWIWNESPETRRIRGVRGRDFVKCAHCVDRDYCSVCMCRNYNETGDIFTPAQHFCDVAKMNHEIVEKRFAMIESGRSG